MEHLEGKTNHELVDIIIDWMPNAPKKFKPSWTLKMKKMILEGKRLTPRQHLGLLNVIVGWNCDGRNPIPRRRD